MDNEALNAVKKGNSAKLKELLAQGINVNAQDANGRTLLHHAASNGHHAAVQYLLKHGADVLVTTDKNNTALHIAVMNDDQGMVSVIIKNVARDKLRPLLDAKTKATGTAVLHVAAKNDFKTIAFLLLHGANFEIRNNVGEKPVDLLSKASYKTLFQMIEIIFRKAKNGYERLFDEVKKYNNLNVSTLILNCRNNEGYTIVQVLILNDHSKLVPEMLQWEWCQPKTTVVWADRNHKNEIDELAESFREWREFWRQKRLVIQTLCCTATEQCCELQSKKIFLIPDEQEVTIAEMACQALEKAYQMLLKYREFEGKGINLCMTDVSIKTLEDVLEILGFDSEELFGRAYDYEKLPSRYKDHVGQLLHLMNHAIDTSFYFLLRFIYSLRIYDAVKVDDVDKVKDLMEKGGGFKYGSCPDNRAALCHAVERGNDEMISLLIHSGATLADEGAVSPICLAIKNGNAKVVKLILDHVADEDMPGVIDCREERKSTALHVAAEEGRLDFVKILLSYGATYCILDAEGRTSLNVTINKDVGDFLKLVDQCFQDAKRADNKLAFKMKAMQTEDFMAVASTRNDEGHRLAVVAAKANAKNIAFIILKMIRAAKQNEE